MPWVAVGPFMEGYTIPTTGSHTTYMRQLPAWEAPKKHIFADGDGDLRLPSSQWMDTMTVNQMQICFPVREKPQCAKGTHHRLIECVM